MTHERCDCHECTQARVKTWTLDIPPILPDEPCAIREYFKRHPEAGAVWMVCNCRQCSPWC